MTGRPPRPHPDCLACRHYFVTYEPSFPHGCRAFAIRTKRLPADEVRLSSGRDCLAFERRPPPAARRPAGPGAR